MRDAPPCPPIGPVPDSSRSPAPTDDFAPAKSSAAAPLGRRVTQLDVARAAGVHNTTVSLALRNSPAIPESTRRRIQAVAEQMGYSPDPALRALVAYRNGLAANRRTESIAYVTNRASRWGWREIPSEEQYFVGAQRRAAAGGYQIEHFWLGESGMSAPRLSSVLFHRGISGLLLAPPGMPCADAGDFDWSRLSAVQIGWRAPAPALHRVTNDPAGDLRLAIDRLLAAGYRRPGLVLPRTWDDADDRAWSIAFLTEQTRRAELQPVPLLYQDDADTAAAGSFPPAPGASAVRPWLEEFRPDVILGSARLVLSALRASGIRVPADVGLIELFSPDAAGEIASVRQSSARVGEVAAELLIGQLQQNVRGLPEIPTTTLVPGVWCDGASLPFRPAANWTARARRLTVECRSTVVTAA